MANPAPEEAAAPPRHRHRLALLVTVVLVATVLALLPRTLQSLVVELLGEPTRTVYEITPEHTIVEIRPGRRLESALYASIVVANIDESTRVATLRVSGHRACTTRSPAASALCGPRTSIGTCRLRSRATSRA